MVIKETWKLKNGTKVVKEITNGKAKYFENMEVHSLTLNKRYCESEKVEKISSIFEFNVSLKLSGGQGDVLKINNSQVDNNKLVEAIKEYIVSTGYEL